MAQKFSLEDSPDFLKIAIFSKLRKEGVRLLIIFTVFGQFLTCNKFIGKFYKIYYKIWFKKS